MPREYDLGGGWSVNILAVDPTTGAAVSGVTFSNACLMVTKLTPGPVSGLAAGGQPGAPLWVPLPLDEQPASSSTAAGEGP